MSTLLTSLDAATLTIRLNRPESANAFNFEMLDALQGALMQAAGDSQTRCVVLTGTGNAFSSGHDLNEMLAAQDKDVSYRTHLQKTYNPLILQIRGMEKPVIAALNGPVAGAGLGVALACDVRIAAEEVSFTVGFTGIGLVPDSAVSLLLPVIIGLGRATEFTFSNQPISAQQALEWGLVNWVVPGDSLHSKTAEFTARLAAGSLGAFGLSKRLFNKTMLSNLEDVLDYEAHLQEIASGGADHQKGVKAFLKNRTRN